MGWWLHTWPSLPYIHFHGTVLYIKNILTMLKIFWVDSCSCVNRVVGSKTLSFIKQFIGSINHKSSYININFRPQVSSWSILNRAWFRPEHPLMKMLIEVTNVFIYFQTIVRQKKDGVRRYKWGWTGILFEMEQPHDHHLVRDGHVAGGGEHGRCHPFSWRSIHQSTQGHPLCLLSIL